MVSETLKHYFVTLLAIFVTNIVIHTLCNYKGCNHWTYLFGFDAICNACIDFSKWIKDYQFMLYGSIISTLLVKINDHTENIKKL
jgi:hypothetical protein